MSSLVAAGHLDGGDSLEGSAEGHDPRVGPGREIDYRLSPSGSALFTRLGVPLESGRRPAIRYCIDWTEQRHHLAGAVGRGLRDRLEELGWIERARADRAVRVTQVGRTALADTFGIAV